MAPSPDMECLSSRFCPRGGTGDVRCWGLGQRRPRPRTASAAEDFCSKAHLERGSEGRWRAGSEVPWAHVRCCRRSGEGAAGAGCCRRQSVDCAGVLAVGGETRRAHGPRLVSNTSHPARPKWLWGRFHCESNLSPARSKVGEYGGTSGFLGYGVDSSLPASRSPSDALDCDCSLGPDPRVWAQTPWESPMAG